MNQVIEFVVLLQNLQKYRPNPFTYKSNTKSVLMLLFQTLWFRNGNQKFVVFVVCQKIHYCFEKVTGSINSPSNLNDNLWQREK